MIYYQNRNLLFLVSVLAATVLSVNASKASAYPELNYTIEKTWDNRTTEDDAKVHISFQIIEETPGQRALLIQIDAPFYDEPRIPRDTPTDRPFLGLWNYEVVEAFFLGKNDEYLEIELAPRGHYILLFFKERYNLITYQLPLTNYTTTYSTMSGRWMGKAVIPGEYFPCEITRFNAYAIHKADDNRVYMSLFPEPTGQFTKPDFHRFESFGPANFHPEINSLSKCMNSNLDE